MGAVGAYKVLAFMNGYLLAIPIDKDYGAGIDHLYPGANVGVRNAIVVLVFREIDTVRRCGGCSGPLQAPGTA